eukprot:TRINITY_DN35085_c0_g1_i3.p1 TRINITY_DN35085_c0_g1~~TRINITY_DN35085_c0_g1_i3.p1  ORF type:complete len:113 (-),score=16.76 TRINITY_DN35085_c0_g1_i3:228-566(-)
MTSSSAPMCKSIMDQVSGKVIATGPKCGRPFPLLVPPPQNKHASSFSCFSSNDVWRLWHNRLGHPHSKMLSFMFNNGMINENKISLRNVSDTCSACKLGKSKVLPFFLSNLV